MKQTIPALLFTAVFVLSAAVLPASVIAHGQATAQRGNGRSEQAQVTAEERREQVQQKRETRTAAIKERVDERQAQVLQDVCERRETKLNALVPRLANQSTRVLSAIDGVYERVQGFYDSGQLTVVDYDEQNDAISEAQTEAQAAVEVATSYEFEFDCDNPSLGDQLFAFREAVTEARDALKTYRSELVGLISSLRAAAAEDATADDSGDDTSESDSEDASDDSEDSELDESESNEESESSESEEDNA